VDRRAFIATMGLTVLAEPIAARAQQPAKMAPIGFLVTASIGSPEFRATVDPFRRGLRDLGYVEGRDLIIEYRSADGNQARFPSLASDLVRLNVDLILAGSTPHARAAQRATRTIPDRHLHDARDRSSPGCHHDQSSWQLWVIPSPTDSWPASRDRAGTSPDGPDRHGGRG